MASDETMSTHVQYSSSSVHGDYDDHPHNLSRLSMCNNSTITITTTTTTTTTNVISSSQGATDDDDVGIYMSRLSIEEEGEHGGSDGDADEEFSEKKGNGLHHHHHHKERGLVVSFLLSSSDSDRESGCLSLPATPPRRRNRRGFSSLNLQGLGVKDYASENELVEAAAHKGSNSSNSGVIISSGNKKMMRGNPRSKRSSFFNRERWFERSNNWAKKRTYNNNNSNNSNNSNKEDDEIDDHEGLVMITRPKGGSRSLCMDLGEVKACRDLGFELEQERMLEIHAPRISISASTIDTTSSGGNSPIANWRISSPGDDPKDVKARLKVWAQAVALASSASHRPYSPNN